MRSSLNGVRSTLLFDLASIVSHTVMLVDLTPFISCQVDDIPAEPTPSSRGLLPMRAVTIIPRKRASLGLEDIAQPAAARDAVLVKTLAIGICGTDRELIDGQYGEAPAGETRLVLGHESLGRVLEAPPGSGFSQGDAVVG